MDIKNLDSLPAVQNVPSEQQSSAGSETISPNEISGGLSNTPDTLEQFQANPFVTLADSHDNEVIVQFQEGDPDKPIITGNLLDRSEKPPQANPYAGHAAKDIARFMFTDHDPQFEGLQNYAAQIGNNDLRRSLTDYVKVSQMSEGSVEFLIGLAGKLTKGDSQKQLNLMQQMLDQLKQGKEELTKKLADGSVKPATNEQLNHLFKFLSNWPPED